jgi:tetratricopeptide (TPR) repeat protein
MENPDRLHQDGAAFVQTLTAADKGQVNAVQNGDQYNYIYRHSPPYRVAPFTDPGAIPAGLARVPSRLLTARHQIVPFVARPELGQLQEWRDGAPPGLSVRLVHAEGGQGKTRLAAEFAARSARAGWAVAVARHRSEAASAGGGDEHLTVRPPGLVLIVDYAERWPLDDLIALIRQHRDAAKDRLRILLLGRSAGTWWQGLAGQLATLDIQGVDVLGMQGLPADSGARTRMYVAARDRFAEIFAVADPAAIPAPADLDEPVFALTLTVHMRALVDVDAASRGRIPPAGSGQADLSSYLLDREHDYWRSAHDGGRGPVRATETTMGRAVYVAILTRPLPRAEAAEALGRTRAASGPQASADLLDDHARCYPPADPALALEPLYPDRLGEDFLALTLPGREDQFGYHATDAWAVTAPELLLRPAGGDPGPAPGTKQAMATLIQAAIRWPHITQIHLLPLLAARPQLALTAGGTALAALTSLPGISPAILEAIEAHLPGHRHVDLDTGIAALAQRLAEHRLPKTSEPAEQARIKNNLALALHRAGLYQQAVAPALEAVMLYLQLTRANPVAYATAFGICASNVATCMSELGQREDAVFHSEMAVKILRLASVYPGARVEPDLAGALRGLAAHLSEAGRREEALAAIEEAVAIWRRVAADDPAASEDDLAMSLHNLAIIVADLGREEEALAALEEAIAIDRRLTAANPDAFEPDLAKSLSNLATRLSLLGRSEESISASREAVQIQRRLAAVNPAAFESSLSASLEKLGMALPADAHEEAVVLVEEAVQIARRRAAASPAASERELAASLSDLGLLLSRTGRRQDALAPTREAMQMYRRLAAADPAAFEPGLAKSLRIFAVVRALHSTLGTLFAVNQAIRQVNPAFRDTGPFRQDGAPALRGAELLEALAAIRDSAVIFQRLAAGLPEAYGSEPQMSLFIAGHILHVLERPQEARELERLTEAGHIDEAVDLLRKTAAEEGALIYLVRGKDEGREAWHLVKIARSKLAAFKQELQTRSLDVSEYGDIIRSGWGKDPPEEVMKELTEQYGE